MLGPEAAQIEIMSNEKLQKRLGVTAAELSGTKKKVRTFRNVHDLCSCSTQFAQESSILGSIFGHKDKA